MTIELTYGLNLHYIEPMGKYNVRALMNFALPKGSLNLPPIECIPCILFTAVKCLLFIQPPIGRGALATQLLVDKAEFGAEVT